MTERNFMEMQRQKFVEDKNVCVGLDTEREKISKEIEEFLRGKYSLPSFGATGPLMVAFNKEIIDATRDIAAAYKANAGYYEGEGLQGIYALYETARYLKQAATDVPLIFDGKRGDIGNTNKGYARWAFDDTGIGLNADAMTLHNYLGSEAMQPFLKGYKDKFFFVLCRTSNEGAGEFQDKIVEPEMIAFYEFVARRVYYWNEYSNCGLVVGATFPVELERVRKLVGDMPILIPGIGAQGGDLEATVKAAMYIDPKTGEKSFPAIINSSRGIIYASSGVDFAQAARAEAIRLRDEINKYRQEAIGKCQTSS